MRVHGNSARRGHCKGLPATERHETVARWHTKNAEEFLSKVSRFGAAVVTQGLSLRATVVNAWFVALHALLAQAVRPLAGGSPSVARSEIQEPQFQRFFVALWQAGQNKPNTLHTRSIGRQERVRPNPSVERTSTGLARAATQVIVTLRGPIRFRPAHLKR
jgi:hypothetical protein